MFKFFNLIKREKAYPEQTDSTGKGKYLIYGVNNAFPLRLSELVQGSPTASACISTITDFITGEGFNEPKVENIVVNNQGLTFTEFHSMLSASLALFEGFAFLCKYSKAGKILEVYPLPFENCRLGKPDSKGYIGKIFYNPYFGSGKFRDQDTEEYPVWSNDEITVRGQITDPKYKGSIFWYGVRSPLNIFYPRPHYFSAEHWMDVERRTSEMFKKNLQGGLLQSAVMKLTGDPNEPSQQPSETDVDDAGNPVMITKGELLERALNDFQGSENTNVLLTLWAPNKESFPEIQAIPTFANSEIYKVQAELAGEKILTATKVPSILAINREGQSLGGDGNSMRAATKIMQQRALRPQAILLDTYKKILARLASGAFTGDLRITPYNPFPEIQNVDPSVWAEMSREERRKWIEDNTEIVLIAEPVQQQQPIQSEPAQQAKFTNLSFNSYPEKARENAKKVIEWLELTKNKCGGGAGRKITEKIINGDQLTMKEIRRLSRYLSKNTIHKDKEWSKSCEAVDYYAWGGSEMMLWANEKVKEVFES